MRIIVTESQFKRVLLVETKTEVLPDDKLGRAKSLLKKLMGRGFNLGESSAMVGNMWIESGFDPTITSGNGAIGLMQWLNEPRKQALLSFALHLGTHWSNEETQLDFIKIELQDGYELSNGKIIGKGGDYEVSQFNSAMEGDTIRKKAENFAKQVERCGGCDGTITNRKESAKKLYDFYKGTYIPEETKKSKPTYTPKETIKSKPTYFVVCPKKGGDGYVNVREKANRDSERISKITSPSKVGKVSEEIIDSDNNKWYKVTLDKKVGNYTFGWVRSDMVVKCSN